MLHVGEQINVYSHFPRLFSDLGEILYERSAHEAVQQLRVPRKSANVRPYYSYRRKLHYIYACNVKPYNILIVK